MDINTMLRGVECGCGRRHTCEIQWVYIEEHAIMRLREICCHDRKILLVADENTFAAAGEQTLTALADKDLRRVIFPGTELLVPNEAAIGAVTEALADAELIVGIGSGVIQDLCKYVSHFEKVPYVIVATAPSMDGYASNGAAMITDGMKVTYPAGLPRAIVADPDILRLAPMEMLRAGYGDVIGKFSALNDWKLSALVNGEYFCRWIYDLTYAQIQKTVALADGICKREAESVQALMKALVIIGILMSFAGSSRPASGSEHHLSHFFEITGILEQAPYFPHGIDVAYSTVVTARLREEILAKPFPDRVFRLPEQKYGEVQSRIYGPIAEGCMALQKKVGNYTAERLPVYLEKEAEIRAVLSEMPSAAEIRRLLALVGLDMAAFYDLYSEEKRKNAVFYAKELKDRYTVLWLYYDFYGEHAHV